MFPLTLLIIHANKLPKHQQICSAPQEIEKNILTYLVLKTTKHTHLIDRCQLLEEALGSAEQGVTVGTHHQVAHVPLRAERVQQQLLPVGQAEGRQHHKVILVAHQERGDGQGLRRLIRA